MMELPQKRRRVLESKIWYHGTTSDQIESIKKGINSKYNMEKSTGLDFGFGFYLKATFEEAAKYIFELQEVERKMCSVQESDGILSNSMPVPIVCEFELDRPPVEYFESEMYNCCLLCKYDDEFANFVFENRVQDEAGKNLHSYDMIYGVESDSKPTTEIIKYKLGISTKEEVLNTFKKSTSMKQLYIQNQSICDIIKLRAVYTFNTPCGERKELML